MHVKIFTGALPDGHQTPIHNDAAELVRMGFNPSSLERVDAIKALAAALISECRIAAEEGGDQRGAATAITNIQQGAMWAVYAATA